MSYRLRVLPETGLDMQEQLLTGEVVTFEMPVIETANTKILFDESVFNWCYHGYIKEEDELPAQYIEGSGEHYMNMMVNDPRNPWTNRFVSIGCFPHGNAGDALSINGIAVKIVEVWLEQKNKENYGRGRWAWKLKVELIK